jgi:DNA-binding MarR family transcriptional regulator
VESILEKFYDSPMPDLPVSTLDRPDATIGYLLNEGASLWGRRAQEVLAPYGLTVKHVVCLEVIVCHGPLPQQEVGIRTKVDRTTVVAIVDSLEGQGFVERQTNPQDRRAYALVSTIKGVQWLEQVTEKLMAMEAELLNRLSMKERDLLTELLFRVVGR